MAPPLTYPEFTAAAEPIPEGFYGPGPDWLARAEALDARAERHAGWGHADLAERDRRTAAHCRYLQRHAESGFGGEYSPTHFEAEYAAGRLALEAGRVAA